MSHYLHGPNGTKEIPLHIMKYLVEQGVVMNGDKLPDEHLSLFTYFNPVVIGVSWGKENGKNVINGQLIRMSDPSGNRFLVLTRAKIKKNLI